MSGAGGVVMTAHSSTARSIGVAYGARKGLVPTPRPRVQGGHVFALKNAILPVSVVSQFARSLLNVSLISFKS
jgi:hypothetical protein